MSLYKIDRDGNIWEYDASAWKWTGPLIGYPPTVVKARSLAGGQLLHRLDEDGSIWQYSWNGETGAQTWSQIYKDPNTRAIASAIDGNFCQLHGDGRILTLTNPFATATWQEIGNTPTTRAIAVTPLPTFGPGSAPIYRLDGDGSIWMYIEPPITGWLQIGTPGGAIAIASDSNYLYKLHSDGSIWSYDGSPVWNQLSPPSNVRSIATGIGAGIGTTGHSLYSLDSDGVIAQYIVSGGLPGLWQQLEKDPAAIAIAADPGRYVDPASVVAGAPSQLYRLNNDGRILSYQPLTVGSPHPVRLEKSSFSTGLDWGWVEIDHNPDTISIVAVTFPLSA